jgi:hypothetical protein
VPCRRRPARGAAVPGLPHAGPFDLAGPAGLDESLSGSWERRCQAAAAGRQAAATAEPSAAGESACPGREGGWCLLKVQIPLPVPHPPEISQHRRSQAQVPSPCIPSPFHSKRWNGRFHVPSIPKSDEPVAPTSPYRHDRLIGP